MLALVIINQKPFPRMRIFYSHRQVILCKSFSMTYTNRFVVFVCSGKAGITETSAPRTYKDMVAGVNKKEDRHANAYAFMLCKVVFKFE